MHWNKAFFQESIKLFGCIPPSLGNYGLATCKNGSEYSMREVNNLIDCPKSCTKYTMRVRSEYVILFDKEALENPTIKIIFNELITVSHESYSYIWLNLVAEVGGYVGLFLGLSVFQMTDLVDMLLQRNWIESFKSLLNRLKPVKTWLSEDFRTSISKVYSALFALLRLASQFHKITSYSLSISPF